MALPMSTKVVLISLPPSPHSVVLTCPPLDLLSPTHPPADPLPTYSDFTSSTRTHGGSVVDAGLSYTSHGSMGEREQEGQLVSAGVRSHNGLSVGARALDGEDPLPGPPHGAVLTGEKVTYLALAGTTPILATD